jgi:hypothetical protein
MNINSIKNLFIYHPGGTGGNHLANLISLIPLFEPRLDYYEGDYQQAFNKEYDRFTDPFFLPVLTTQIQNVKAHFLQKHGLTGIEDPEYAGKILSNKRINILTGHWHCFYSSSKYLTEFNNHAWIKMSFPKEDSLAYKRIRVFNFWPQHIDLYDESYEINEPTMNSENSVYFDTVKFFQDDGSEYLREFLKQHFEIELPAIADEMHKKWMYGLTKTLDLFPDIN